MSDPLHPASDPVAAPPHPATPDAASASSEPPTPAPRRRSRGLIVAVVLLSVALVAAVGALVWYMLQLEQARATIEDDERRIEEQQEYVDRKDVFSTAMQALVDETRSFEGLPYAALVPWDEFQMLAAQGWARRWDLDALDATIASIEARTAELAERRAAAEAEAASNATGNPYETHLDALGAGYTTWLLEDADALCDADVLACVKGEDPFVVHVDAADDAQPWMTDWIRTGLAYHEFAHVLQFTNPAETEEALTAFDGDHERMADCFALTYLDGWTLDHRVWITSRSWWDVDVGYGYVCDDTQRAAVREWRDGLGIRSRPIGAGVSN